MPGTYTHYVLTTPSGKYKYENIEVQNYYESFNANQEQELEPILGLSDSPLHSPCTP